MLDYHRSDDLLPFRVGGLLYTPATNERMADKLLSGAFPRLSSVAFCLEDAIMDGAVPIAEQQLLQTLKSLQQSENTQLPLIFVRVRSPQHLAHVHDRLGELETLLTGYIFPKFDTSNADSYLDTLGGINAGLRKLLYGMPILESASIARAETRISSLEKLFSTIGFYKEQILNIRVGGNDLCSQFGIRRTVDQTIYDAGVVRDALVDILNVFGRDYVVSGPVWEYYGQRGDVWEVGLRAEMRLDVVNGFVGKTAIHPCQLPVIYEMLRVKKADYEDARALVDWGSDSEAVARGYGRQRMNELKCHSKWARKILCLSQIYGVIGDE